VLDHPSGAGAGGQKGAREVDRHDGVELGPRDIEHGCCAEPGARPAGHVGEQLRRAERLGHQCHRRLDLGLVGHVGRGGHGPDAAPFEFLDQ
jgi:hypothetical protein